MGRQLAGILPISHLFFSKLQFLGISLADADQVASTEGVASTEQVAVVLATCRQLEPVSPGAPAHVVKALVDQVETAALGGIQLRWQLPLPPLGRQAGPLVLHLPDPPAGGFNAPDAQKFGRIATVAMAHRVYQRLLQPQPQPCLQRPEGHRLDQQLDQRCQLQGGWRDEVRPAQRHLLV